MEKALPTQPERIKKLCKWLIYKGYADNEGELADLLGYNRSSFSQFLNAQKPITANFIKRISEIDENINKVYITTGEGEMFIETSLPEIKEPDSIYGKKVPYYDIDFTASFLEIENNQQNKPDHYVTHPFFLGCDYIVRASGQSMAKVIKHGDAIGLVQIKNWQEFIPLGEIYAIVTKNQFRMIKIITKGEDKSTFTLISKPMDGKKDEFPPQQIKKDQILSIFRVQAASHLF